MNKYYLAIDIGASSGRHILGHLENGKMILEEIHRFPNGNIEKDGELIWDIDGLFREILVGMKKCKEAGKIPVSVGIDTWAVDIVLLDEEDKRIGNAVAYRDSGTRGMDKKVYELIPEEELYARTGIQKQIFNTIYQLMAWKNNKPEQYAKAKTMLMVPDYLHFLLSGVKATEYTNATTTQLVSPITKDWDFELIETLNYSPSLFTQVVLPGTCLGSLTEEVQREVGFDCKVVVPATHDTGSAVMAVPVQKNENSAGEQESDDNILYISSGTWSLMGTELLEANCSLESKACNLTNEGGYDFRFRYLKNIMGLWMIQSVKKEIGQEYSFGEICEMASKTDIPSIVDVNDDRFLAPKNMTEEVKKACEESSQPVPKDLAEVTAVIYNSLAKCYGKTIAEIEELSGMKFDGIHIVGGGSNAEYLNELTALATGKTVYAGPTEATAIGNLSAQMIAGEELKDLKDVRNCIYESFDIQIYQ
ncbi:MAG: rhamnulokinase [Agathobacter sp.]|nr:rhamnulokinase [Agathobacter sp.]